MISFSTDSLAILALTSANLLEENTIPNYIAPIHYLELLMLWGDWGGLELIPS